MASTSDIRDIMNLGQAGPRQPAPKKKKTAESQPRVTGVRREVQALMGDSVPPIAIVEQRSYKSRPTISQKLFKPRHWEERTFQHGARADGLVLRHWKRSIPGSTARTPVVSTTSADVEMGDDAKTTPAPQEPVFEDEYPSHKWNVKVQVPAYTDEQYENMLKSDDWSRHETDYLMELCRDYDLRWIIVADRYDITEIPEPTPAISLEEAATVGTGGRPKYPPRTMESLKQRYYAIAAKMMEAVTPASTMTAAEFQLWEKMRTFDAKTETMRKAMAEKLFERTKDEADEERILLEELHRITKNEDDFIKMRRDLYARLEPVAPLRRSGNGEEQSTAMYQTSGGLSMLLQSLLAKEKRLKRPTLPDGTSASASAATPTDPRHEKSRQSSQYNRRDTLDTQATNDDSHKKSSVSQAPAVRVLAPADAAKFGVSHPQERLTSGVQFRHEKINRLTMAKSQTQTTKIQAALTELGIPARLLMPTERVCREFERLVGEINTLLDSRKVSDKVSAEIRVLQEQRRIRLGLPKEGNEAGIADQKTSGNTGPSGTRGVPGGTVAMEINDSQMGDTSKVDENMTMAEEDQDAEAEDDEPTQISLGDVHGQTPKDEDSTMQVDKQNDEEEDVNEESGVKVAEDEEDEEEQNDEEVTGLDNEDEDEDDEDEDDDADADDQPRIGAEVDEDDEEEDEAEVAPTPQEDSDAEEADSDDEPEPQVQADSDEEEEQEEEEEEDEDEAEVNDDSSDAEAQAQARAVAEDSDEEEAGSEEDEDEDDEDVPPSAPQAEAEDDDSDEDGAEDQPEEEAEDGEDDEDEDEPAPPPAPAARSAHKRSASVISEASRAGSHRSNRSGVGRKKRR